MFSLLISGLVLTHLKYQKTQYRKERKELFESLSALRENIWEDQLINTRICDKLQSELHAYRMKYWLLSSPLCHYHLTRCINLLTRDDFPNHLNIIRKHLNYIIARLTKKE